MVLLLALFSGILCKTSQCSTILPSASNLNISMPAQLLILPATPDNNVSLHNLLLLSLAWNTLVSRDILLPFSQNTLWKIPCRQLLLDCAECIPLHLSLDRLGRIVPIKHQVIEGLYVPFVTFNLFYHLSFLLSVEKKLKTIT